MLGLDDELPKIKKYIKFSNYISNRNVIVRFFDKWLIVKVNNFMALASSKLNIFGLNKTRYLVTSLWVRSIKLVIVLSSFMHQLVYGKINQQMNQHDIMR